MNNARTGATDACAAGAPKNVRLHRLLFVAVMLAYVLIAWQSVAAPLFVLDDADELTYVRTGRHFSTFFLYDFYSFFRPVKNLLFLAFEHLARHGLYAARLLAIGVGLASLAAVNALFRRLLRDPAAALLASACWLLAPSMVSCTAWLSCVNIQAMAGAAALAVTLYLRSRERSASADPASLAGAWLAALLAMFSYEGAVCLPGVVFAVDFFLYPERLRARATWRAYGVLFTALLAYLALRAMRGISCTLNGSFTPMADWQVSVTAAWFTLQHLEIWLWPFGRQAAFGGYFWGQVPPVSLALAWAGVAGLGALCLLGRRRFAVPALGLAWFFIGFLPTSNLLAFRNGPYGDYYMAFASLGLALAVAWALRALAAAARLQTAAVWAAPAFVLIAVWRLAAVGESVVWSHAWQSPHTVLERSHRTFPQAFDVINELARSHYQRGEYEASLALTGECLALAPERRVAYMLRALIAERRGKIEEAARNLQQFRKLARDMDPWGWYFQGYLDETYLADTNGAVRCYHQAVKLGQRWSDDVLGSLSALALLAAQQGDAERAIALWEQNLRVKPDRTEDRHNLMVTYARTGRQAQAAAQRAILNHQTLRHREAVQ